jgi:hypothetical protein
MAGSQSDGASAHACTAEPHEPPLHRRKLETGLPNALSPPENRS